MPTSTGLDSGLGLLFTCGTLGRELEMSLSCDICKMEIVMLGPALAYGMGST